MSSQSYFGQPQSHTSQGGGGRDWGRIEKTQSHSVDEKEDEGTAQMEVDEEDGGDKKKPASKNPVVAFRDECKKLIESCPAAIYDNDQGLKFILPVANLPAEIKDKFDRVDVRIIRATTGGLDENVTNYVIGLHIFPVPVHTSPLVALIERVAQNSFTDAISSIRQLLFFFQYFYKVALDDAEYCKLCYGAYIRIINDVDDTFFYDVDQLCAGIQSEANPGGYSPEQAATFFGVAVEEYALKRIRAVEWTILDMLGIPLRFREGLLTPSYLPPARKLSLEQGTTLRKNLCFYLRKRKDIIGGGLKVLDQHGLLVDGIRVDGHLLPARKIKDENRPMVEGEDGPEMDVEDDADGMTGVIGERTYQGDILQVLTLEADFQQPANHKFKEWICAKTLYNYLMFLNTPKSQ